MSKKAPAPVAPFPSVAGDESLPADLRYALRAASWAAGAGESLVFASFFWKAAEKAIHDARQKSESICIKNNPLLKLPKPITSGEFFNGHLTDLRQFLPVARQAVESVAVEIAAARQTVEPIRSAGQAASSWHELAIAFALYVFQTAEDAAEDADWTARYLSPDADYDASLDTASVRREAAEAALAEVGNLDEGWRAAIVLETARAADARRQKQTLNTKPVAVESPANSTKKNGKRRQPGRPVSRDLKQDARILKAWKSGQYRDTYELAAALNLSRYKVLKAIDSARKPWKK